MAQKYYFWSKLLSFDYWGGVLRQPIASGHVRVEIKSECRNSDLSGNATRQILVVRMFSSREASLAVFRPAGFSVRR